MSGTSDSDPAEASAAASGQRSQRGVSTGGRGTVLAVLVLLAVGGCVALAVLVTFRSGAYALAGVLAVLGLARLLLPVRLLGPLAVRGRLLDALLLLLMAAGLLVLASGVPL